MRRTLQRCASSLPKHVTRTSQIGRWPSTQTFRLGSVINHSLLTRRTIHNALSVANQAASPLAVDADDASPEPISRFDDLQVRGIIHQNITKNLKGMGLETMTEVQSATINEALNGTDVIAQAKTGTGKTVAFLLPVLQNILKVDPSLAQRINARRPARTTADDIRAIVISPTRELAEQIAVEARKMVRGTGIVVQTAVGGSNKSAGLRTIKRDGCHILVGTPGRLKDILSDPYSRVEAPDLSALVLDEADRLLDAGFWPEIQEIMGMLPDRKQHDRQTLMFSATVPREVVSLVKSTMRPGYQFVKCVREDDTPTHERVPQRIVKVKGYENKLPALVEFIHRQMVASAEPGAKPFKAIVYFNTAAEVALSSYALRAMVDSSSAASRSTHPWGTRFVREIQSRLSQAQRDRATDDFRRCTSGVLISSDVTARGMDFPDVTHVIQMSAPPTRESYIHRIGRTARAGKEGEGIIFLAAAESPNCREKLRGINMSEDSSLKLATFDMTKAADLPVGPGSLLTMVQTALSRVPDELKTKTYMGVLGSSIGSMPLPKIVESLNNQAMYGWGLASPPGIPRGLAAKMGLSRVPGIVINDAPRSALSSQSPSRESRDGGPFRTSSFDRNGRGGRSSQDRFAERRPRFENAGHREMRDGRERSSSASYSRPWAETRGFERRNDYNRAQGDGRNLERHTDRRSSLRDRDHSGWGRYSGSNFATSEQQQQIEL